MIKNTSTFVYHESKCYHWLGDLWRRSFKAKFGARRKPENVVNYVAPSVTLKCEFHLCEGVGAKPLTTLSHGCPSGPPLHL